jgi:hypothetical protein
MSAHTPGPWKAEGPYSVKGGGHTIEVGAEIGAGHITVAMVGFDKGDRETEAASWADARLIAAAPDGLFAAHKAVEAITLLVPPSRELGGRCWCPDHRNVSEEGHGERCGKTQTAMNFLRAFVAKAEGSR